MEYKNQLCLQDLQWLLHHFFITIGNHAFAIEYTNEKCGVSINYPKDWKVENQDYIVEDKSKTNSRYSSGEDDIFALDITFGIFQITEKKQVNYESEENLFDHLKRIQNLEYKDIIEINGFPTQKLLMLKECRMNMNYKRKNFILWSIYTCYDRIYQIKLEADKQDNLINMLHSLRK